MGFFAGHQWPRFDKAEESEEGSVRFRKPSLQSSKEKGPTFAIQEQGVGAVPERGWVWAEGWLNCRCWPRMDRGGGGGGPREREGRRCHL